MTREFVIAKVKTIIDNPELKAARLIEYKNRNYAQHKLVQQFQGLLNQLGDDYSASLKKSEDEVQDGYDPSL